MDSQSRRRLLSGCGTALVFALAGCADNSNSETDGGTTEADRGPRSEQNTTTEDTADTESDSEDSDAEGDDESEEPQVSESSLPGWTSWIPESGYDEGQIFSMDYSLAEKKYGGGPFRAVGAGARDLVAVGIGGYRDANRYVSFDTRDSLVNIVTGDIQPAQVVEALELSGSPRTYKGYEVYETENRQTGINDSALVIGRDVEAVIDARAGDERRAIKPDETDGTFVKRVAGDPIIVIGPPGLRGELVADIDVSGYTIRRNGVDKPNTLDEIHAFETTQVLDDATSGLSNREIAETYLSGATWKREIQDITRDGRFLRVRVTTYDVESFIRTRPA